MLLQTDTHARTLQLGSQTWPMAIGKTGACSAAQKREGDGRTPVGRYWLESLFFSPDRLALPDCALPAQRITDALGWCDAPKHASYNRLISKPFSASHETLMRADGLYDALIVLSHNRWPAVPGYGSAIFLHMAKEGGGALAPTQGCLALRPPDFLEMLVQLPPRAEIAIY